MSGAEPQSRLLPVGRWQPLMITATAVLVLVVAYVFRVAGDGLHPWDLGTVACLGVAMIVGELLRLGGPSGRGIAPVATAAAVALAFTSQVGDHSVTYGAPTVVVVVALVLLLSAIWREKRELLRFRIAGHGVRVIVVGFLAVAFRELPLVHGASLSSAASRNELEPWALTVALVGLALGGLLLELGLHVWLRMALVHRPWRVVLHEDVTEMVPIAAASMVTGVVVALGMRSLSLAAIVLFLIPLVLMRIAIDRRRSAQLARRQAITALSRLTDLAGYTTGGHAERVAGLCDRVAARLQMSEREVVDLEAAALLHDIGQVAMHRPVPHGATIDLAPLDQQRIADDGADLVERTGALDVPAAIIREHPTSYRVVHEEGRRLSVSARVLKVCNAYDDLTRGDASRRDAALERIMLGLGYEYDPQVVTQLQQVTTAPPADGPRGSRRRRETQPDVY